jgi:alanyl-tRNA synthetase
MKTDEIRRRFLDFFRRMNHRIVPPDSLVPANDPSLLFTGAGMNQFKDEFYGRGDRSLKRAATCQKCLRTGDIENVGKTASHHTFFEMLGNFSFGDYFKREAIEWAWQFMREDMGIPQKNMVVTIYEEDDEAEHTWRDVIGLPEQKIFRFGESDNFWPENARTQGPNGPCGPCSEIHFDSGHGCGQPSCDPACKCGRFVELYNLVFQQYDRQEDGTLAPLPMCNIDTGMGLERMARVIQGVDSNFEIDIFRPIMDVIYDVCGRKPEPDGPGMPYMRRIADHARAVVFCIADGVIPSNEERGYVVRRLLRRAVRDAHQLGVDQPFMARLVEPVIGVFTEPYPELAEARSHVETLIAEEEKSFQRTVKRGSNLLAQHVANLKRQRATVLRGKEVFNLYQTYGFPVEMTESILAEEGMQVDMQGFLHEMAAHQQLSKKGAAFDEAVFAMGPLTRLQEQNPSTEFTGYSTLESLGAVIGIVQSDALVDAAEAGEQATVVLDRTPAYGEAGGQVGDHGWILPETGEGPQFEFETVRREKGFFLHVGRVLSGRLTVGSRILCRVDKDVRMAVARNHTATHLLHNALRQVLGEHAKQSGSHVSRERLRFDFANPTELGAERLRQIEDLVAQKILQDDPVISTRMSLSEARESGAIALFGETYGDIVRVISIGDYSRELCGGTHCERTGQIGLFRITRESSVAGGVRRIEAVTGLGVLARLRRREEQVSALSELLGTPDEDLLRRVRELQDEIRSLQKQVQQEKERAARRIASGSLLEQAEHISRARLIMAKMEGGISELRSAADVLRKTNERLVCLLASTDGGKVAFVAAASADLVREGLSARELARDAAAIVGGSGGGRDDLAQGGGPNVSGLEQAFDRVRQLVREKLER